jgi:hypothetical protein
MRPPAHQELGDEKAWNSAATGLFVEGSAVAPAHEGDSNQPLPEEPILRPPLADDPDLPEMLEVLDDGLADGPANPDWLVEPPLLTARLVLPLPQEPSRRVLRKRPAKVSAQAAVSEWVTSAVLILAMFAGATGAALVFHDRLSTVVARWEIPLR